MITVKLYGLLRIESGIRELCIDAGSVNEVLNDLMKRGISAQQIKGCIILVNGKQTGRRCTLQDGDVVQLLPSAAGG